MPCRYGSTPLHRVQVELVEADIEIGFELIDSIETFPGEAARLVADAEDVYRDAQARIGRLEPAEQAGFQPLMTELRRAIDRALPPA